jgi:hypothetical protein
MNFHEARKCPDCAGTGVVGIYAHKSVKAVEMGRPIHAVYTAVVVCTCAEADKRYGSVQVDQKPIGRYFPQGYCRLPDPFYRATPATREADIRNMRQWLDERGTARVGEFTVDDWRG